MIKECLVINENGESVLFTDFPKGLKSEQFNEIASYYFEDKNIGKYHCFKNLGFYDDGYTNKDDDERYLIENGNINYRVGYDEVKKIYDVDIDNLYLHKAYCEDCYENLFSYTEDVNSSCECWSCGEKFILNKDTLLQKIK